MNSHQQFWRPREVTPGRTCLWRLGGLRLWVQRTETGWRLAREQGTSYDQMNASVVPNDVVPSGLAWTSLPWRGGGNHFFLRPEMPDRPLVARPEERVLIPAGEQMTYYCLLPCWARFFVGEKEGATTGRFDAWPTRELSDTWFGDHASGVLAYALVFPAGPNWQDLPIGPHHVIVPVRIENNSVESLHFERLCLRPEFLGVFAAGPTLWSNAIAVAYQGTGRASSLRYESAAPAEAGKSVTALTEPAERAHRSLAGFTFSGPSPSDFRSCAP